jgi:hypothetical protein
VLVSKIDIPVIDIESVVTINTKFDVDNMVLINQVRLQSIRERFGRETDSLFLEAKRATVISRTVIPPWFIFLTVILGWNEIMVILRNPMLTLLFAIGLAASYAIWYTNMSGPIYQVIYAGSAEFGNQMKNALKEKGFDVDDTVRNVRGKINQVVGQLQGNQPVVRDGNENIEMSKLSRPILSETDLSDKKLK